MVAYGLDVPLEVFVEEGTAVESGFCDLDRGQDAHPPSEN